MHKKSICVPIEEGLERAALFAYGNMAVCWRYILAGSTGARSCLAREFRRGRDQELPIGAGGVLNRDAHVFGDRLQQ
ncbi:MAG: hypothetical protein ACOX4F_03030 [Atopobiaceae bacterium]